jgi:hypothetical protein
MKNATDVYRRILSEEEFQQGKLMVTKDALRFFPKPFKKFTLAVGDKTLEAAVEAVECHCMGLAQPHEHYWLPLKDNARPLEWEKGRRVTVTRQKDATYVVSIG